MAVRVQDMQKDLVFLNTSVVIVDRLSCFRFFNIYIFYYFLLFPYVLEYEYRLKIIEKKVDEVEEDTEVRR